MVDFLRKRFDWLLVAAVALSGFLGAVPSASASALERLEKTLARADNIHAEFTMIRSVDLTGEDLTGGGHMVLVQPDRFRLVYTHPDRQEVVVEGNTLWVVLHDENQAMRFPYDPNDSGSELYVLFGGGKQSLHDLFDVTVEPWANYEEALRLVPKSEQTASVIEELRVVVGASGYPERVFYREITGDSVVFGVTKIEKNPASALKDVTLKLPPDMEIIDGKEMVQPD